MPLPATLAAVFHLAIAATAAEPPCGSLMRAAGGTTVDLAPPAGFVEICAQDQVLCRTLTARYPASVQTLAYFVTAREWAAHAHAPTAPFHRYLIVQVTPSKSAAQLEEVKSFIRSQQADVPARAQLAERLQADGQAGLGVFDDTADSISFGAVAKLPAPAADAKAGLLAMTNSALAVRHQLLSLYVYSNVDSAAHVGQVEDLTKRWIGCLRAANRP